MDKGNIVVSRDTELYKFLTTMWVMRQRRDAIEYLRNFPRDEDVGMESVLLFGTLPPEINKVTGIITITSQMLTLRRPKLQEGQEINSVTLEATIAFHNQLANEADESFIIQKY